VQAVLLTPEAGVIWGNTASFATKFLTKKQRTEERRYFDTPTLSSNQFITLQKIT